MENIEYLAKKAYENWQLAKNYFNFAAEEQLVYFSALHLEAEKNKFMYMLKRAQDAGEKQKVSLKG